VFFGGVRILYNILFFIGFALSSPYYYWRMRRRGNWRVGFRQRFAKYDAKFKQAITNRHTLWMHAVSVGEVGICTQLIRALERRAPNLKIVVSTTTSTGMGELQRLLPPHISRVYYPLDLRSYVSRALNIVRPKAIVLVEAEIWPNFLWQASKMDIPVFLVNARLSDKSFRGYRRFGFLFRPIFRSFAGVGVQNDADAERLRLVGVRPEVIHNIGSLKYDAAKLEDRRVVDVPRMFQQLGLPAGVPVLLGGSTHAGEEAILAKVFKNLRVRFPDLFLVLVPRHFERSAEVGRELTAAGIRFAYRNKISVTSKFRPREVDCLLVNTTGELKFFYEHATVVFVGKSLSAEGGQNPIEPGALARAMVFGPNMQNFADIAEKFVQRQGALRVKDSAELERAVGELLADPARRAEMGTAALAVVRENLGGIDRTVDVILQNVDTSELYVKSA
jgi:3-deoxy-D-manno-octulosonic-acid transferase